ncbi:MAG: phosphate-starvation-inducible PsiE family protein [Thermomicrobiales bacterium]
MAGNERDRPQEQGNTGGDKSVAEAVAIEEEVPGTRRQQRIVKQLDPFFDGAILLIYGVTAVLLLALAVAALGYALAAVPGNLREGVPFTITTLLSELLLVLILVEVLRTIITYISTNTTSIRPFLTVAIISSVRRILSIGANLSAKQEVSHEEFNRAMIELAAEGGIILVVAVALYLFSRRDSN